MYEDGQRIYKKWRPSLFTCIGTNEGLFKQMKDKEGFFSV